MSLKKFQISAPGKIILHGEHSVVYNKPAIAGPIGLRTFFNFEEREENFVTLQYVKLNLIAQMKVSKANELLSDLNCNESLKPAEFLTRIRASKEFILKYVDFEDGRKLIEKEEMAVCASLYIFNRILRAENIKSIDKGFAVKIDSDMSIGAGVGSSASYGVCLAGGFYLYSQIINQKFSDWSAFEQFSFATSMEKISQWAFDSEVIMHEKPSGIDNTICTYGQLIRFVRGQAPDPIKMNGRINILLVDTGVSRSTSHIVGKVANFKNKHPSLVNSICDAMGHLVDDVVSILESSKDDKYQELGLLVSVNNNLLRSLDVSHPRLEKLFYISESHGFHAKLTGAGGGGCAFVLLPENYEQLEKYLKLCDELRENNYQIMATHIVDGSGVTFKSL